MASRMEKYYHNDKIPSRTKKNASLYDELYDNVKYSNVEGIANIASSNEIDIRKIKKLISEKENDRLDTAFVRKTVVCNNDNDEVLEEKNYDLKVVLDDAKKSRPKEEKERYVQNFKNSNFLEKLNELNASDVKMDDLTNIATLSSLGDNELSLDLLDSLKSNDNTFIGNLDERTKKEEETEEIDSSFYTAGMHFSKDDFEELDGINKNIKKNNIWITILVFIILVIVITGGLFLFNFLF